MTYLFTRSTRLGQGSMVDSMAWATKVTEQVNQVGDLEVSLWSTVFSPGVGTVSWTAAVDDIGQLTETDEKLANDRDFLSLITEGSKYTIPGSFDDGLMNLVHSDPDAASGRPLYAVVVTADLAPGSFVRGIEVGVEIAQRVKAITGRPSSFGTGMTGRYGAVGWITLCDTIQQVQQSEEAIAADMGFVQFLDAEVGSVYQPQAATQMVYRKIL